MSQEMFVDSDSEKTTPSGNSDTEAWSMTSSKPDPSSEPPLEWHPLVLTKEKFVQLWNKMREFPIAWDDLSPPNADSFYTIMTNPKNHFYEFGDAIGLAAATNVRPRLDANFHLMMFDRRLRGR